jgi:hypothetical protein
MDESVRQAIGLGDGEPRSSEYTGTKALMMAVLEGGIRDYCGGAGVRCTAEATAWVRSDRPGAFSFVVTCETLGLEPDTVRRALLRLKYQSPLPSGRIRPDVRKKRLTAKSK